MAVIALAALSAVLVVTATRTCSDTGLEAVPSGAAKRAVPANYLSLYRLAGRGSGVPWTVLAAIGSIETDHGRSRAPGVRSGVNRHGCCAGPMQFNLRDGPPSTWQGYRVDGNHDGATDLYNPTPRSPRPPPTCTPSCPGRRQPAGGDPRLQPLLRLRQRVSDVLARAPTR